MKYNALKIPVPVQAAPAVNQFIPVKLITFLLIILFVQVSAQGYAQITLNLKNAPLVKVLSSIKKQTGYTFFYNQRIKTGAITINVKNASITETLNKCFASLPIVYKIVDKTIFLNEKKTLTITFGMLPDQSGAYSSTEVSGTITNEEYRPIEGATILIKEIGSGVGTNSKGAFHLSNVPENSVLSIKSVGYKPVDLRIRRSGNRFRAYANEEEDADNLKSGNGADVSFSLRLVTEIVNLTGVAINVNTTKQLGTVVDLKHRSHLSLGQVLEGSVPGLTLKSSTSTNQTVSIKMGGYGTFTGPDEIRVLYEKLLRATDITGFQAAFPTFDSFYRNTFSQADNTEPGSIVNMVTSTTNNGLVPELRGSSSFTGNLAGMMVVIDGVEQNNFPADYPMNNVAKVEVIKDPAELVKWGPKATGGLILITSNKARAGKLQFNYGTNLYFSGKPDISNSKLQLASSADVLDYYKEQVEKGLANYIPLYDNGVVPKGLKPAQWLLYNLKKKGLPYSDPKFSSSWDSLSRLSNRDQLRQLYQNTFRQIHSLNIAGGVSAYRFNLGGVYTNTPGRDAGNKASSANLNLQNIFSLLKNKLKINWQINTTNSTGQSALATDVSFLDPYQLLLNPQGGYIYDYPGLASSDVNQAMLRLGYPENGINALENVRNTSNRSKTVGVNSRFNMDWDLSKGLQWSTAFVYNRATLKSSALYGANTGYVRDLTNTYASPDGVGGINFYTPPGGILNMKNTKTEDWNLRSGLSYNHIFGKRNAVNAALGFGLANTAISSIPDATIFGYSPDTPNGLPLLTPPANGITNYYGTTQYLSQLRVRDFSTASYIRSLSLNGNFGYTYDNRYSLNLQFGSLYTPNVGFIPSYSSTESYDAIASWHINKEHFFNVPYISTLKLSAVASKIQLGTAPDQITAGSINQPLWNNTALVVSNFNPTQINGQNINNIGGLVQIGFNEERIHLFAGYNHLSDGTNQLNGQFVYEMHRERWFKIPAISRLVIDGSLQNFNALQAQAIVMGTNSPSAGGGFSMANSNNYGILPPSTINKEAHLSLGFWKDRLTFDARYYHKVVSGTSGSGLVPPDPSTGLSSQLSYSRILNKGVELYLRGNVVHSGDFSYAITINGAYNINKALDIPNIPFSQYPAYLTAYHTGYATDGIWSYRWAGLDNKGNPQVYKDKDTKVAVLSGNDADGKPITTVLDASSVVYSGRTRAPWSGGMIHEWAYKNFFASARVIFNLGYIMRTYVPVASPLLDKNFLIANRWKNPGDEAFTDIAAMAQTDPNRTLVIQNATNSIVSADNIRLREIQFGYEVPSGKLKKGFFKALTVSAQIENVALWTRNKLGIDPDAISSNGLLSFTAPRQYVLTLNASF